MLTKIQKVEDFALHRKCKVFYWGGDCMKRICTAILMVLFAHALLADASAGAHIFARRDNGTNIVSRLVPDGSDVATVDYVDKVAAGALFALTNDFVKNFTPLAAPIITNVVDDVLAPRTMEFHYHADGGTATTNAFVAPRFATSRLTFVKDDAPSATNDSYSAGSDRGYLYSEGKLRNYSMLLESLPEDRGYCTLTFYDLAKTHRIYAQPRLYTSQYEKMEGSDEYVPYSWDLVTNDLPCVVTVREPEAGTLVISRTRLDQEETYIRMENDEPVIYTDGAPE